jgi:hypothetical protein
MIRLPREFHADERHRRASVASRLFYLRKDRQAISVCPARSRGNRVREKA